MCAVMSQPALRIVQIVVVLVVGFSAIYFQQSTGYQINGFIVAAWCFMAAYGVTMGIYKLAEWRDRRRVLR